MRISQSRYHMGLKPHITGRDDDHSAKDQGSIQQMKWRNYSAFQCWLLLITANPIWIFPVCLSMNCSRSFEVP
jgi:hypothetical protein